MADKIITSENSDLKFVVTSALEEEIFSSENIAKSIEVFYVHKLTLFWSGDTELAFSKNEKHFQMSLCPKWPLC